MPAVVTAPRTTTAPRCTYVAGAIRTHRTTRYRSVVRGARNQE
jgi:hypothetical protein